MSAQSTTKHQAYGGERVRRGLLNFLVGKMASSLLGFAAIVLVIRGLSVAEFAQYSVLIAFVEIGVALSGFGIAQVILRYVPELYATQQGAVLERLLARLLTLRSLLLLLFVACGFLLSPWIVGWVGLQGALGAFKVFLLIVFLRGTAYLLSQILESTLHQGWSQAAFSLSSAIKLIGAAALLWSNSLTLLSVVWLEALADLMAVAVLGVGLVRGGLMGHLVEAQDKQSNEAWFTQNMRALFRYAITGYLQHLAILPYGGHTNRLVGGATMSTFGMANFGFAQTMYEYVKRYLPAQLLMGMVRPVVLARYEQTGDFSAAVRLCSQIMQINFLFCGLIVVTALVGGEEAFLLLTKQKYGLDALQIFLALTLVLVLETHRQQIDLLVQVTKRYEDLIGSNLMVSASVLLAVALIPNLGGIAFPLANTLGLAAANWLAISRMKKRGFTAAFDWVSTAMIIVATMFAIGVGLGLERYGVHWLWATFIACIAFMALVYFFMFEFILSFWKNTSGGTNVTTLVYPEATKPAAPVRIAFGLLSSKQSAACVEQIADAVYPHTLYVHHDFTKVADWSVKRTNVRILRDPVKTAWGDWSLVAATLRLMEEATLDSRNTYFQLLSESCMPVRPISEFVTYLEQERPDLMIEMVAMNDIAILRSHGWRYLSGPGLVRRLLRKLCVSVYPTSSRQVKSGVNVNVVEPTATGSWSRRIVDELMKMALTRLESTLSVGHGCALALGSQWMGMSMPAVHSVLKLRDESPSFMRHFMKTHIPDEAFFQTIAMTLHRGNPHIRIAGSNHTTFWYKNGTGPDEIDENLAAVSANAGKFFARKFSLDPESEIRQTFMKNVERRYDTR